MANKFNRPLFLITLLLILTNLYVPESASSGIFDKKKRSSSSHNTQGVHEKVRKAQKGIEQLKSRGENPYPDFKFFSKVPSLLKRGKLKRAEQLADKAIRMLDQRGVSVNGSVPQVLGPVTPSVSPRLDSFGKWSHATSNPLIDKKHAPKGLPAYIDSQPVLVWNDPSVMKEGQQYSMWLSLGTFDNKGRIVSIYKLISTDGLNWSVDNNGEPVFRPGKKERGDFDLYGVETPVVIKVGSTYHMYYTAYKNPDPKKGGEGSHLYTMGHATSRDGINWERKGELTSLTFPVGKKQGNPWGWLARAEPAVVFHDGTFYLYFADVKCRQDNCKGNPVAVRGISLATSKDGHNFVQHGKEPVLLQTDSYPPKQGWEGYSTPWVHHNGETFELYVDVFRKVKQGSQQTRISHYRSEDGIHFEEVETDIVKVEGHPWADMSVRAPTVVEENDRILLWYAGDNMNHLVHKQDDIKEGRVVLGVGLMKGKRP